MPEVAFHTGVVDKADYLYRLLRKAGRAGKRVRVSAPAAVLDRLDTYLWVAEPGEFLAHARARQGRDLDPHLGATTPVWLADPKASTPVCDVLINLGPEIDEAAVQHDRVIELVGADDQERLAGRSRWRHYETRQWTLVHHKADRPDER